MVSIGINDLALLETDVYSPVFGGATVNLSMELRLTEWRERIVTRAQVIAAPGHQNEVIAISHVDFLIQVKGSTTRLHPVHPTGTAHPADFLDIEELAIMWNKDVPRRRARLSVFLTSGQRSYDGVIDNVIIVEHPGVDLVDIILRFKVTWNASLVREWNDIPNAFAATFRATSRVNDGSPNTTGAVTFIAAGTLT